MATQCGVQTDFEHVRPLPQTLPQPPQLLASFVGSTHLELHAICGAEQVKLTHWLPVHTLPPVQSPLLQHSKQPVPAQQTPPLAHSVEDTHTPPLQLSAVHESPSLHCASLQHCLQAAPQSFGVLGAHAHWPDWHSAPLLHATSQLPQCPASVWTFTSQSPGLASQSPKPAMQVGLPPAQIWFEPTALPQPPQLFESVLVSTQEAPQAVRPFPQPVLQLTPSQAGMSFGQLTSQAPQCAGSVAGVSQPGVVESQSKCPFSQPHCPAATQIEFGPQSSPHEPQLLLAVTEASQPSPGSPLQSRKPTAQSHFPSPQTWFAPHTLPHPPQLLLSEDVSVSQPLSLRPSQSAVPGGQTQ
jgi:hypothetical protein